MNNDKMRAAIDVLGDIEFALGSRGRELANVIRDALSQQPESEPIREDYPCKCKDCGRAHILDTVLPSEIWNQIAGSEEVLCTVCIDKRLTKKGLNAEAEFYFVGKSLLSKLYPQPSAQVPEEWKETIRLAQHLISMSSSYRGPEVFARLGEILAAPSIAEKREVNPQDQLIFAGYTNGMQILYANEDGEGAFYKDTDGDCCIPLYMLKTHWHRLESTTGGRVTLGRIQAAQQRPEPPEVQS